MKKKTLFTFDYEPYLGAKSGTLDKCLIEPTAVLLNILSKYETKAVFFIDTLYILNLKKQPGLESDYIKVTNQIKELYKKGHYVFPHVHPHWLDAKYLPELKQFDLSNLQKYSLASIENELVETLFQQSFSLLNELDINYKEWGYRAGGWCIQPFCKYAETFNKHNIKYDFSVLPYYRNEKPEQSFDFSQCKEKEPYLFQDDVTLVNNNGKFKEFPISSLEIDDTVKFFSRLVNKYLFEMNDKGYGNGTAAQTAALKSTQANVEMISIDILNMAKLDSYKKFINRNNYMHWISHPKMFTRHGLKIFDKFLNYAYSKFVIEHDFMRFETEHDFILHAA